MCVCNEVFSLPIVYVLNNDACIHFRCKTHLLRITFLSFVLPLDPVDTMFSITPCNDMSFLTISLEILTGFPLILVPSPSNPLNCLIGFFFWPFVMCPNHLKWYLGSQNHNRNQIRIVCSGLRIPLYIVCYIRSHMVRNICMVALVYSDDALTDADTWLQCYLYIDVLKFMLLLWSVFMVYKC